MFRHKGKSRTYQHNLRLAALLSVVAGIVNVTGVLALKVLTTNVTGHFAFFSEDLANRHYGVALVYLLFILSFLLGAFLSNLLIEAVSRVRPQISYVFPMAIEIALLTGVGIFIHYPVLTDQSAQLTACLLLLAMGLQNSLVTKVSESVVRTTHLTGLFTDLGIELSQLFFYRSTHQFQQLAKSIYLKLAIIGGFFAGCVGGAFAFKILALKTLLPASGFLTIALFYDNLRFQYYQLKRKSQLL